MILTRYLRRPLES